MKYSLTKDASVDWAIMTLIHEVVLFAFFFLLPTITGPKSWQEAMRGAPHTHALCPRVLGTHLLHPSGWAHLSQELLPGTLCPGAVTLLLTFPEAAFSLSETNYNQFSILHGNGEDTGLENS